MKGEWVKIDGEWQPPKQRTPSRNAQDVPVGVFIAVVIIAGVAFLFLGNNTENRSGRRSTKNQVAVPNKYEVLAIGRERLEACLRDPDSLQIIEESCVVPDRYGDEATYAARYRAKNGFGGYVEDIRLDAWVHLKGD